MCLGSERKIGGWRGGGGGGGRSSWLSTLVRQPIPACLYIASACMFCLVQECLRCPPPHTFPFPRIPSETSPRVQTIIIGVRTVCPRTLLVFFLDSFIIRPSVVRVSPDLEGCLDCSKEVRVLASCSGVPCDR